MTKKADNKAVGVHTADGSLEPRWGGIPTRATGSGLHG